MIKRTQLIRLWLNEIWEPATAIIDNTIFKLLWHFHFGDMNFSVYYGLISSSSVFDIRVRGTIARFCSRYRTETEKKEKCTYTLPRGRSRTHSPVVRLAYMCTLVMGSMISTHSVPDIVLREKEDKRWVITYIYTSKIKSFTSNHKTTSLFKLMKNL